MIDAVNADAEERTKNNRNRALEEALLAITDAEVPECWILDETRRKFALMMQEVSSQGTCRASVGMGVGGRGDRRRSTIDDRRAHHITLTTLQQHPFTSVK